jgi:hypothetical protein
MGEVLNLGTIWSVWLSFRPSRFTPGVEGPRFKLNRRRLRWPQSQSEWFGDEKDVLPLLGIERLSLMAYGKRNSGSNGSTGKAKNGRTLEE